MSLPCGCEPIWLTSISSPVTAEEAVAEPCSCCGASTGKRCIGGHSGWLPTPVVRDGKPKPEARSHVQLCPARLGKEPELVGAGAFRNNQETNDA